MLKVGFRGFREILSAALLFAVAQNVDGFLSIPAYTHGISIRVSSSKVVANDECYGTVALVLGLLSL